MYTDQFVSLEVREKLFQNFQILNYLYLKDALL